MRQYIPYHPQVFRYMHRSLVTTTFRGRGKEQVHFYAGIGRGRLRGRQPRDVEVLVNRAPSSSLQSPRGERPATYHRTLSNPNTIHPI